MSRDAIAGLALLAASLVLFALTLDLKPSPLVPIGPGFYPRIVLGLTGVLAAALVVLDFVQKKERVALPAADYAAVALHFGLFGVYVVALPWLGYRIATVVYVVAANAFMAPPRSARQWGGALTLGLATSLITYYIFEHYLHVLLPRGRWTDF